MSEKVIVSVTEGKIQGFKSTSPFSGAEFYSFLGVPYGQSTAGSARFKDPVPVKPWKNILNASSEKGGCLQFSLLKKKISGTEDCLYNNIHTPKVPQKNGNDSLKAVIALLHPGMYLYGSPDPGEFGSTDFVMHNDIVYVCISFRLHILGFLNLGLEECSGNQGLKDIILSLRWIQNNISNFGGDPNNVTLLGSSIGAELIHNLMVSPRAKGLFHKGVIMGLTRYCPSIIILEEHITPAYKMAQTLGYSGPCDKKKLYSFYRKLDMNKFLYARSDRFAYTQEDAPVCPISPFTTSFDYGIDPVIPSCDKQESLESTMKIPLIIGFTRSEAAMAFVVQFRHLVKKNFYKSVRQNSRGWGHKLNDNQIQIIQKRAELHYLNGQATETAPLTKKCEILSDIALSDTYPSLINVVATDLPSSVFVYKFEFEGDTLKMKDLFDFALEEPLPGTMHGDDFSYWSQFIPSFLKKEDVLASSKRETIEFVNKFTKLICTFAKTGNPNNEEMVTEWRPTTVENPCYMTIDSHSHMVDGKLFSNLDFWENIKEEFENGGLTTA